MGANRLPDGSWEFLLWAPQARAVSLHLAARRGELLPMEPLAGGYHRRPSDSLDPGARIFLPARRWAGLARSGLPIPISRSARSLPGRRPGCFRWTDHNWKGTTLERSIFYELHVGTYTPEGTFDALIPHLPELADLGITTIELMPVAQFPGSRNWGYDGVYLFAPQNTYGGPRIAPAIGERGPSARSLRRARRGLQPSRAGRQLP